MQVNTDKRIVTLDTDRFLDLLALAELGAKENDQQIQVDGLMRHAAKFNQHIPNYSAQKNLAPIRQRRIEKARRCFLLAHYVGKHVYVQEIDGTLTRFTLIGRDAGSTYMMRVFGWSYYHRKAIRLSVKPSDVLLEVPPDYEVFLEGSWRGCYMKRVNPQNAIP